MGPSFGRRPGATRFTAVFSSWSSGSWDFSSAGRRWRSITCRCSWGTDREGVALHLPEGYRSFDFLRPAREPGDDDGHELRDARDPLFGEARLRRPERRSVSLRRGARRQEPLGDRDVGSVSKRATFVTTRRRISHASSSCPSSAAAAASNISLAINAESKRESVLRMARASRMSACRRRPSIASARPSAHRARMRTTSTLIPSINMSGERWMFFHTARRRSYATSGAPS